MAWSFNPEKAPGVRSWVQWQNFYSFYAPQCVSTCEKTRDPANGYGGYESFPVLGSVCVPNLKSLKHGRILKGFEWNERIAVPFTLVRRVPKFLILSVAVPILISLTASALFTFGLKSAGVCLVHFASAFVFVLLVNLGSLLISLKPEEILFSKITPFSPGFSFYGKAIGFLLLFGSLVHLLAHLALVGSITAPTRLYSKVAKSMFTDYFLPIYAAFGLGLKTFCFAIFSVNLILIHQTKYQSDALLGLRINVPSILLFLVNSFCFFWIYSAVRYWEVYVLSLHFSLRFCGENPKRLSLVLKKSFRQIGTIALVGLLWPFLSFITLLPRFVFLFFRPTPLRSGVKLADRVLVPISRLTTAVEAAVAKVAPETLAVSAIKGKGLRRAASYACGLPRDRPGVAANRFVGYALWAGLNCVNAVCAVIWVYAFGKAEGMIEGIGLVYLVSILCSLFVTQFFVKMYLIGSVSLYTTCLLLKTKRLIKNGEREFADSCDLSKEN